LKEKTPVLRTVLAVVAGALVAPPATVDAVAKPKALPRCLTVADAAGDAGLNELAQSNDPSLDLVAVRFPAAADASFLTAFTVAEWADRPVTGVGHRFQVTLTVAGRVVDVYYKSGPARAQEAELFYQQGVRVDGVFKSDAVTATRKGNTLTVAVKLGVLRTAVGTRVEGVRATGVTATTWSSYVATNTEVDAVTTKAPLVLGGTCR